MRFMETDIVGAKVIDPSPHQDERGRFLRAWCAREFAEHGLDFLPVQANMGFSIKRGTVRGMHFQEAPAIEAKLVRCTRGAIFDVVLDLRPESPSYGKWYGVELSAENGSNALCTRELCARIPDARGMHGDVLHGLGVLHSQARCVACDSTIPRSVFNGRWPPRWFLNRIATGRSLSGRKFTLKAKEVKQNIALLLVHVIRT